MTPKKAEHHTDFELIMTVEGIVEATGKQKLKIIIIFPIFRYDIPSENFISFE